MFDVTALGEVLIDFTPSGLSEKDNPLFECNPGGAPANVLAALAKLNKKTAFIGKVGNDQFGRFLCSVLKENHISTEGLVFSGETATTLAFVHLDQTGDRSFSFYRNPGADMMLEFHEVNVRLIEQSRIFHFGSLSLTNEPAASATLQAIQHAKQHGVLVSYDPNLREPLWHSLEYAKEMILKGMSYADIVKVSEEELYFLTDCQDLAEGTRILQETYDIQLMFVTLGSKGSFYRCGSVTGEVQGFQVTAIDTTGAGDAFMGAVLVKVLENGKPVRELHEEELMEVARFANAAGALTTTRKGAIPSVPSIEEIQDLCKNTHIVGKG